MKCFRIKKRLSSYIDGELPEKKRMRISAHLGVCPFCRREMIALSKIDDLLDTLSEIEVAPYLYSRLKAGISMIREEGRPSFILHGILKKVLVALTMVVIFIFALAAGSYLAGFLYSNGRLKKGSDMSFLSGAELINDFPEGSLVNTYVELLKEERK